MKLQIVLLGVLLSTFATALHGQTQTDTSAAPAAQSVQTQVEAAGSEITKQIRETKPEWSISFGKVFWSIITLLAGFVAVRYSTRLLEGIGERWSRFRLPIKGLIPIARISGWTFVAYIIIADIIVPPIATLVAVTASAGIAVGFASQDILKNIFGGIMILFDRPFQVGDKIEVGSYYGEVVSIGLRTVRIVTPDDSLVAIPNSEIVIQSVANANAGESYCQVVAELFLPADIDLERVKGIARRAAMVSRYVYINKPVAVVIRNEVHHGRSLLKLRLKAYVLDIRYEFAFSTEMTECVISEILKHKLVSPQQLEFLPASR